MFLVSGPLGAASQITHVRFEGLVQTEEVAAKRFLSSVEGSAYSKERINRDIKALYQSGLFSDVKVKMENTAGGVSLVFYVQEKGVLKSIVFRGNKKIKDKELLNAISVRQENLLDERRIAESEQILRDLYDEKGYFLAEVASEVVPFSTESNELELIFNIQENREVKIKRISFVGNKFFSDRKLAKKMKTKVKGMFSFLSSSGKLKNEKLEQDIALLTYFYLTEGFVKVKLGEPQVSLTRDKKAIYITIPVHEGLQYKVRAVGVSGSIITTEEELLHQLHLKKGEVYNRQIQDQDAQTLTTLYGDQAYAFANVYPTIETHDETKTADVTFVIDRGRKIAIEHIIIKGNTITRDKVIRRELKVVENAPYSKSGLEKSRKNLMQLGYFADVNFSTPRGSRDDLVDLVVEVEEKPTGTFSIGAGFSSLESFIFTASVQKDNFFGRGIYGSVGANLSKLRQEFNLSVTDRYFLDTRWIVSGSIHRYDSALNRDFDQKSFGGSVSFGREVFPNFDMSVGYSIADVSVTNFSSQVPAFFQQNSSGLTSSVTSAIGYDTRDNRLTTTKGMFHQVSGSYAGNGLGGDNNFWKLQTDSRYFLKPVGKTVLKARGMFAYVNSLRSDPVPLFERYFLGGINTLRGYDLNSIGPQLRIPRSASGGDRLFTYGGNRMMLFNLEYEVPIYDAAGLRFVVFADSGQAFAESEDLDLTKLRSNYGAGLRWISPFGPLRFEWGFPIQRRSDESKTVFNFTIGQSF